MTTADDKFFAWLDGELDAAEAGAMAAKVAADPELARLAAQHRALGAQLKGAFDPIAAAPVPERLQRMVRPNGNVIDLAAARRRPPKALPQWAAIAATLALGILVGTFVSQQGSAPLAVQGGQLYAAAGLDHALTGQLASAPAGDTRVGVTFRNQAGMICRTFTQEAVSGLACRDGARWQLRGLFSAPAEQSGDYRMAAGMDPNLANLMDSQISGEPLDAAQEKAARDRGWR